jgi:hypothetical protein
VTPGHLKRVVFALTMAHNAIRGNVALQRELAALIAELKQGLAEVIK